MPNRIPVTIPFVEQLYLLARPANVTLPTLVLLAGYVAGGGSLFMSDWRLGVLVVAGFLVHSGLTIVNDLSDRKVDVDNDVETIITRGSEKDVRRVWVSSVALIVAGMVLTLLLPVFVQVGVWTMALLGIAYNTKPLLLSHRPHLSIAALGVLYATLPFLVGYFMYATEISWQILLLAVFWGCARAAISILKDFKDVKGDKKHGKHTFLLRHGRKVTLVASNSLAVVGLVGVVVVGLWFVAPVYQYLYIATLAAAAGIIVRARHDMQVKTGRENDYFQQLLMVQVFFDGGVLLWLTLS